MILQRNQPIRIWGTCDGLSKLRISLAGTWTEAAICGSRFEAVLSSLPAMQDLTMRLVGTTVSGEKETLEIREIAVGEVWVAGGQSNMEFPLKYDMEAEQMMQLLEDPLFRYYDVPKICYEGQEDEQSFNGAGSWRHFNSENMGLFSAAAVYFALKVRKEEDVPVGIIGCNWGATSASSWMSREYLEEYPELDFYQKSYEETIRDLDLEWYREAFLERQAFGLLPRVQEINDAINTGKMSSEEALAHFAGLSDRQKELFSLPVGPMDQRRPCILFEMMVKRIAGYGVRGVIWYQGEADEVLPDSYALLFSQMIRCWRAAWGANLPFLCVQLAPFGEWLGNTGKEFPKLRRQQALAEKMLDQVWLASIMDAGMKTDIHPKTKRAAGERLALLALGKVYGKDILCEAPEPADVFWEKDKVTIFMQHAGSGLYRTGQGENPEGLVLRQNGEILEFTSEIRRDRIVLKSSLLREEAQVQVEYAQEPYVEADLYNSAGICAKPFLAVRPYQKPE